MRRIYETLKGWDGMDERSRCKDEEGKATPTHTPSHTPHLHSLGRSRH